MKDRKRRRRGTGNQCRDSNAGEIAQARLPPSRMPVPAIAIAIGAAFTQVFVSRDKRNDCGEGHLKTGTQNAFGLNDQNHHGGPRNGSER